MFVANKIQLTDSPMKIASSLVGKTVRYLNQKPSSLPKNDGIRTFKIESVDDVPQDVQNAVAGDVIFVRNGRVSAGGEGAHPRTAVALTEDGRTMLWIVVDGRQPNYSEGVTMPELATIAISHGAHIALNLDGGGSSTLVRAEPDGEPSIINSPVHVRYPPGGERAVANHLGLKVDRAGR